MFQFGIGGLFGRPISGNLATPSTPVQFGVIQDVSLDMDQKLVELRGQNKFPEDVAPSDMTIKGKAAFGRIEIDTYNNLFYADEISSGIEIIADREEQTVPATPFELYVTNSDDFLADLGVIYKATGMPFERVTPTTVSDESHTVPTTPFQITVTGTATFLGDLGVTHLGVPMTRVPSSPATGEYSVNEATGLYTFAAADVAFVVLISYQTATVSAAGQYAVSESLGRYKFNTADAAALVLISYTYSSAAGRTMAVKNHIQGFGPVFELYLSQPYQGTNGMKLYRVRASKMSAPMKRDGYLISDFEFEAFAAPDGSVFDWFQVSA
jgi:hypothetical protein